MKKLFLLTFGFTMLFCSFKGQNPFISCLINFEDDPCWETSYIDIEIPGSNNLWQECTPQKLIFNSAHSLPHAILTDSLGSYPVNTVSSFIIKFLPEQSGMCAPVIGANYKFDSDTLNDYGMIELSYDHGATWLNALSDTVIPDPYWWTPKPILTGRIHQWTNFHAFIPYPFLNFDTIYYRFTFISDNTQTNQEGWMIDDIALVDHIEGFQNFDSEREIKLYPNPVINLISLQFKNINNEMNVSIYDFQGKLCFQQIIQNTQSDIDVSKLYSGIYLIIAYNRNNYYKIKFIKE
jgi:hypothetical protein